MGKLLNLLSMFGPLGAAKFWVAAVMALAMFARVYFGIDLGLDEATVTAIVGGIGAALVWLVPNLKSHGLTDEEARQEVYRQTGRYPTGPVTRR